MTTILFVHGTGVRKSSYDHTFEHVRAGLAKVRPGWEVARCFWGDEHGAKLNAAGVTVPAASTRGPGEDDDPGVALWWVLERDPLFELRVLAAGNGSSSELPPSADLPGEHLVESARALPDGPLAESLVEAGLAEVFPDAIAAVLEDEDCLGALSREHELGGELTAALARAFVAEALVAEDLRLGGPVPLTGRARDELVEATIAALGGSDRGLGGALGKLAVNAALRMGVTKPVERRRAALLDAFTPVAGDVLVYLARGGGVQQFIADRIAEVEGPVVVLAHSLGGIAALELLATHSLPQVELLVTVGSQGPLLYELDALPTLPFGEPLPDSVPRWVNVYDHRDLLAYVGSGVFPGRVVDHVVDNRAPFPRSHSAYFWQRNKRFYRLLDEVLP